MNLIARYMVAFLGNAFKDYKSQVCFFVPNYLDIFQLVRLEMWNLFAFIFSSVDLI